MGDCVSKVSYAGQITLSKRIKEDLRLRKNSCILFERRRDAVLIRKLQTDKDTLAKIRAKIRKRGLTKKRVEEIVDEVTGEVWKENYRRSLPGYYEDSK